MLVDILSLRSTWRMNDHFLNYLFNSDSRVRPSFLPLKPLVRGAVHSLVTFAALQHERNGAGRGKSSAIPLQASMQNIHIAEADLTAKKTTRLRNALANQT